MTDIVSTVRLYTLSFKLVRPYIDGLEVHASRSEISLKLHEAIRRKISSGSENPVEIAEYAVRSVRERYRSKQDAELR